MPDVNLLVIEKHTIHGLDGSIGCLGGLIMNKTISFGTTDLVGSDFAGQDVTECSERIVKSLILIQYSIITRNYDSILHLVVDLFIKVLDENIALTGLAQGRVALRPHDPATVIR